jgi:hypothetical protein
VFIRTITRNVDDQQIVKAIAQMALGLGKQTIAEFVGDAATVDLLRGYGVDFRSGLPCRQTPAACQSNTTDARDLTCTNDTAGAGREAARTAFLASARDSRSAGFGRLTQSFLLGRREDPPLPQRRGRTRRLVGSGHAYLTCR